MNPREVVKAALWLPMRLRRFVDAEARRRDQELKETLATSSRDVRAELSSLGTELDVVGRRLETLALVVARLEQEVSRLAARKDATGSPVARPQSLPRRGRGEG